MILRTNQHLQSVKTSIPKRGPMTIAQISNYLANLVKMVIFLGQSVITHDSESQQKLKQLIDKSDQILKEKCEEKTTLHVNDCLEQFKKMSDGFKALKNELSTEFKNVMNEKVEQFKGIKNQHQQVEDAVKQYLKGISADIKAENKERKDSNRDFLNMLNDEFQQFRQSLKLVRSEAQTKLLAPLNAAEMAIQQINTLRGQIDQVVMQLKEAALKIGTASIQLEQKIGQQTQILSNAARQITTGVVQLGDSVQTVQNKVVTLNTTIQNANNNVQSHVGESVAKMDSILDNVHAKHESINISVQKMNDKLQNVVEQLDDHIQHAQQVQSVAQKTAQVSNQIDSAAKQIQDVHAQVRASADKVDQIAIKSQSQLDKSVANIELNISELQRSIKELEQSKSDFKQIHLESSQSSIQLVQKTSDMIKQMLDNGLKVVQEKQQHVTDNIQVFEKQTTDQFNAHLRQSYQTYTSFLSEIDNRTKQIIQLQKESAATRSLLQTNLNSTQMQQEIIEAVTRVIKQNTSPLQQMHEYIQGISEYNKQAKDSLQQLVNEAASAKKRFDTLNKQLDQQAIKLENMNIKLDKSQQQVRILDAITDKDQLLKQQIVESEKQKDQLNALIEQRTALLSEYSYQAEDAKRKAQQQTNAFNDMQASIAKQQQQKNNDLAQLTQQIQMEGQKHLQIVERMKKNSALIEKQLTTIQEQDQKLKQQSEQLSQINQQAVEKTGEINDLTEKITLSEQKLKEQLNIFEKTKSAVTKQLRLKAELGEAEVKYLEQINALKEKAQTLESVPTRKREHKQIDQKVQSVGKQRTQKQKTQSVQVLNNSPQLSFSRERNDDDYDDEDDLQFHPQPKRNNYVDPKTTPIIEESKDKGRYPNIQAEHFEGRFENQQKNTDLVDFVDEYAAVGIGALAVTAGGVVIYKFRKRIKEFFFD